MGRHLGRPTRAMSRFHQPHLHFSNLPTDRHHTVRTSGPPSLGGVHGFFTDLVLPHFKEELARAKAADEDTWAILRRK